MRRRRLFFDEKKMSDDVADVLEAAALLEVTEFELFRMAYRRWHGGEIADAELERYYLPCMFKRQVPSWVRALARQIIADAEASRLNPAAYGVMPRPLTIDMYNRGLRYCLWIAVILGTLLTGGNRGGALAVVSILLFPALLLAARLAHDPWKRWSTGCSSW